MQHNSSTKRTVIVTGGYKGIGRALVEGLLAGNAAYDIIFTSRKPEAGKKTLEQLQNSHKQSSSTVTNVQLDLKDPISIQHFVDFIKNDRGKFDVLVNNAAVFANKETPEFKLETINVDLLCTIDLTEKLIPYLSSDGKIIMVSSGYGALSYQGSAIKAALQDPEITKERFMELAGRLYEECEQGRHTESGFSEEAYHASKALLNAYMRWILVRDLKGDQQCFSVDPGWCKTDLGGEHATRTPEEGADTMLYLINEPFKVNKDLHGKFLRDRKVVEF